MAQAQHGKAGAQPPASAGPGAAPAGNLRSAGRQTPKRADTEKAAAEVSVAEIVRRAVVEMKPMIEQTIEAAVATALDTIVPQLEAGLRAENERLHKTVAALTSQLQRQSFEIDKLAQYGRRENVRINGVPETEGENTDDVVIAIARDMGVDIDRRDISVSHRLPKPRALKDRPIIVKFVRRSTKTNIMKSKKALRAIDAYHQTFVNDDLTPLRARMLRAIKNDGDVKRVWTIDGSFHCIITENNVEVKKRLETPDDLFKIGWSEEKLRESGLFTVLQ